MVVTAYLTFHQNIDACTNLNCMSTDVNPRVAVMAEDAALRNFRDFLLIYNRMTEMCFRQCVNNLNYRELTPDESQCVDHCAGKTINVNHRMMSVYMEVQPEMMKRSIEAQQQLNAQQSVQSPS
uniref:Mitochondrial import inner membrane translocase subunit n=1 Tax=Rhipicephalus microplus TaxID=6941 RepID=A0A6M2CNE5_RHIMP